MHLWCTSCFWATLGDFGGLVWFFCAPLGGMIAIFAAEEAALLYKSLKGLLFVVRNKDAGLMLYKMREELKQEARVLIPTLKSLNPELRSRLEKRQSSAEIGAGKETG